MDTWNEAQVSFAIATAKGFEAMRRQAKDKREGNGAGLNAMQAALSP
jgi:hypothetical protein